MMLWFIAIAIPGSCAWRPTRACYGRSTRFTACTFSRITELIGLVHARRRVPRRDRRGGALCRSRPFRPFADPARVVRSGSARARDQLSGAGRASLCTSRGGHQSVLSALSRLGAHPHGGPGDDRHRDCQPGRDHRRVFADQSGDSVRFAAALRNPPHLGASGRPDLHAAGQWLVACRRAAAGGFVPLIERARLGLRHCRHRHHGGDRHDGLRRHLADLAMVGPGGGGA